MKKEYWDVTDELAIEKQEKIVQNGLKFLTN